MRALHAREKCRRGCIHTYTYTVEREGGVLKPRSLYTRGNVLRFLSSYHTRLSFSFLSSSAAGLFVILFSPRSLACVFLNERDGNADWSLQF